MTPISTWKKKLKYSTEKILEGRERFILPILILFILKIVGFLWLYFKLPYHQFYNENPQLIFLRFDSDWYYKAARSWYSEMGCWSWFPAYPILIRLVGSILGKYDVSAVLVAFTLGLAWMPLFQTIAERHISRQEALGCTLLTSLFPTVFLFTTVAYSEPLYLFACLASWYLYTRGRYLQASILSAVVALTRYYGILFVIPMILDRLAHRDWRNIQYTIIPFFTLSLWLYYSYLRTGSWLTLPPFALLSSLLHQFTKTGNLLVWIGGTSRSSITGILITFLTGSEPVAWEPSLTLALVFVALVGYFTLKSWDTDWRLGLYSSLNLLTLLAFASYMPLPRYLVFTFPIWLNMRTKNPATTFLLGCLFYLSALLLWQQLLLGYLVA